MTRQTRPGLIRMSAAWATSNVAQAAIAFATSLMVARGLGSEDFGRWTLCMAWAAAMTMLFDLGFGVLLTREAARENDELGGLVGAAFVARLGLLAPAALIFVAAAPWLAAEADTSAVLRIVPAIAAAGIAYTCLAAVFRAWPQSLVVMLTLETAGALAQFGGVWWMVRHGADVGDLLILVAGVQTAQVIAAAGLWRMRIWRTGRIAWPSLRTLAPAARQAFPFALAGLVANAQLRVAPLMLGLMSTTAAVAAFGAAARVGGLIRMLPQSAFAGALPALSAVDDRRRSLQLRFDRLVAWFAFASAASVALFARPLVTFVYGPAFASAGFVLFWIAVGLLPTLVNGGRKVGLYAAGHEEVAVRWSAVALAIQAVGCAVLIPAFGAAGAAAALAVGEAAVCWQLQRPVQIEKLAGRPVGVVGESPLAG